MRSGIPQEVHSGERRVATTPEVATKLIKLGFSVALQRGAGVAADLSDDAYREAGVDRVVVWLPPAETATVIEALDGYVGQLADL